MPDPKTIRVTEQGHKEPILINESDFDEEIHTKVKDQTGAQEASAEATANSFDFERDVIGTTNFNDPVELTGDATIELKVVVESAFKQAQKEGLSVGEWNALSQDERDNRIEQAIFAAAGSAVQAELGGNRKTPAGNPVGRRPRASIGDDVKQEDIQNLVSKDDLKDGTLLTDEQKAAAKEKADKEQAEKDKAAPGVTTTRRGTGGNGAAKTSETK